MKELDYNTYYDKVLGGWMGKCAGGILGAPLEGYKKFLNVEFGPKLFETNFANDDLDLQVLWLDMLKQKGAYVREEDYAKHWLQHVDFPWCEYGISFRNMTLGLYPPVSGDHNNWYWKTGMGCPIRSEIWGMVCPGMPDKAAYFAGMDASLDHEGFSVDAEKFLSACASIAFFENKIDVIFEGAVQYIDKGTLFFKLYCDVKKWSNLYSIDVCKGKIKSVYGDADFTYAPMNIGLTLLVLLKSDTNFNCLIDALNMGHDSDCITATVGALIGIINGYKNTDDVWKKLITDELLVSAEITGLKHSDTVSGLALETCQVGIHFSEVFNKSKITGANLPNKITIENPRKYHVNVIPNDFSINTLIGGHLLDIEVENLGNKSTDLELNFKSTSLVFENCKIANIVETGKLVKGTVLVKLSEECKRNVLNGTYILPNFEFEIAVKINGNSTEVLKRGLPFYGSWMLMGPFIQDCPELVPLNKKYPDHGLPSLPSLAYMNHDNVNRNTNFITVEQVRDLISKNTLLDQNFQAEKIYPSSFDFNFAPYQNGKGERTYYLYSNLMAEESKKIWITFGSSAYTKIWVNDIEVYENKELKRSWPSAFFFEVDLNKGKNDILIKIDNPLDALKFELSFKQFLNKHPHQSQWDNKLVPFV